MDFSANETVKTYLKELKPALVKQMKAEGTYLKTVMKLESWVTEELANLTEEMTNRVEDYGQKMMAANIAVEIVRDRLEKRILAMDSSL